MTDELREALQAMCAIDGNHAITGIPYLSRLNLRLSFPPDDTVKVRCKLCELEWIHTPKEDKITHTSTLGGEGSVTTRWTVL